jgi:peptidoglycan/xylan/chitin deacetylase (PgdA/CDA1 family)
MYWVRTPNWLKKLLPQLVWDLPTTEKSIYITFDDGPTPGATPQVLAFLREYGAKATFFCLGSQAEKHLQLLEQIKAEGHTLANHGYCHLNGFFTCNDKYIENANRGAIIAGSKLFRPPYGRISPRQINFLKKEYQIIMWSLMSFDFDRKLTPEQCLDNVVKNIFPGAIIVFHDTEKAKERVLYVLPRLLEWIEVNGYRALSMNGC